MLTVSISIKNEFENTVIIWQKYMIAFIFILTILYLYVWALIMTETISCLTNDTRHTFSILTRNSKFLTFWNHKYRQ